jgi:3-phenylpropionate/trans-cinnamate dioxygenase ferredoxin subunit
LGAVTSGKAETEEERMSEWVTVGQAGEIADGEVNSYSVGERQVAIANVGGVLHAFDDLCSHLQCSLAAGELDEVVIECPCHASRFDVTTGEAVQGPATDPVDVFEAREEGDELQVSLE